MERSDRCQGEGGTGSRVQSTGPGATAMRAVLSAPVPAMGRGTLLGRHLSVQLLTPLAASGFCLSPTVGTIPKSLSEKSLFRGTAPVCFARCGVQSLGSAANVHLSAQDPHMERGTEAPSLQVITEAVCSMCIMCPAE